MLQKCQQEMLFRSQNDLQNLLDPPPYYTNENIKVWSRRGSCLGSYWLGSDKSWKLNMRFLTQSSAISTVPVHLDNEKAVPISTLRLLLL